MRLSNSMLSAFIRCPTYGMYRYIHRLFRKGTKDINTAFGRIVHEGLRVFGETGSLDKAIESVRSNPDGSVLSTRSNKSLSVAEVLIRKEVRILEGFDRIVEVEKDFHFPIATHLWMGRWDAIVEDKGLLYVLDYKTTGDSEFQLRPNNQIVSYYIGAQKEFGSQLGGVYIHVLRASDCNIQIFYVKPTPREIEEWENEVIWQAREIESYINLGVFPKNPTFCNLYGRRCEYLPLCQSFGEARQSIMRTEYERRNDDEVE